MNQCAAVRPGGQRCRAQALPGRALCFAHDPENRERASEARRKGGHNSANLTRAARRIPRGMQDVARRILEAFDRVESGELPPDRAHAMARLAAVYVQIHDAGEVQARIEELEARLEQRPGAAGWRR